MINIKDLSFSLGTKVLFENTSFEINPSEHIGLIGRNGCGKSSMLKIFSEEYQAPTGTYNKMRGLKISFFNQDLLSLQTGKNLQDVVEEAFEEVNAWLLEIEEIAVALETDHSDKILNRLAELQNNVLAHDGYDISFKTARVLTGLGFTNDDLSKDFDQFSGGWRMRALLAKCILSTPDLLLLDEPTNHLDLPTIKWLEGYLATYPGTFIVVSHDRHFLDKVCNKILCVDNRKVSTWKGNYTDYQDQFTEQLELIQRAYSNQQKELKDQEKFIERFRSKASKAASVQSRIKLLDKIERIELPDMDKRAMRLKLKPNKQPGRFIFNINEVSKAYADKEIFKNASAAIEKGGKVALIGPNGKGKSTLLRILAGQESHLGSVSLGHNVEVAHYAQHQLESLNPQFTIWDEMQSHCKGFTDQEIRNVLGSFMFSGDDVDKYIRVLSGGEKARVALAKIVTSGANVLLLDEPTNHLDMQSVELLAGALIDYDGSFVLVSHDQHFISLVANTVWVINDGNIFEYPGDYEEFSNSKYVDKLENVPVKRDSTTKPLEKKPESAQNTTQQREHQKNLSRVKDKIEKIEEELENLDSKISEKMEILADVKTYETAGLHEKLTVELDTLHTSKNELTEKWELLYLELEEIEKK